eukprot:6283746-Pyramimonas_sp.AAC.1
MADHLIGIWATRYVDPDSWFAPNDQTHDDVMAALAIVDELVQSKRKSTTEIREIRCGVVSCCRE